MIIYKILNHENERERRNYESLNINNNKNIWKNEKINNRRIMKIKEKNRKRKIKKNDNEKKNFKVGLWK